MDNIKLQKKLKMTDEIWENTDIRNNSFVAIETVEMWESIFIRMKYNTNLIFSLYFTEKLWCKFN